MPFLVRLLWLLAVMGAGALGWGATVVAILRRAGWDSARDDIGPPLRCLVGVALFFAVGGFLVALDVARFAVLLGWNLAGVALLLAELVLWIRRRRRGGVSGSVLRGLLLAGVGGVLFLVALGASMGVQLYNAFDDDPAYIYLAKRMLVTGGLVDPFNLRRLTDYGGSTLYQSMFLQVTGSSSLRGFELIFSLFLLLAVAVETTKRRWLALGVFVLGIGLIIGHGVGFIANLSPTYSIAALTLGVLQLLRRVPRPEEADQPWLYVVIGLLLAGVLALRFSYLLSLGVALVIVVFTLRGRHAWKPALIVAATGAVCSVGWAAALYRSSHSLLFPVMDGNYNASWPTGADPNEFAHGASAFLHFTWAVFSVGGIGWIAVLSVIGGLALLVVSRGEDTGPLVLLGMGAGCVVQLLVYCYSLSGSLAGDVNRLVAPSTLACGLFAFGLLWPRTAGQHEDRADLLGELAQGVRRRTVRAGFSGLQRVSGSVALTVCTVVVLVGLAGLMFGASVTGIAASSRTNFRYGIDVADQSLRVPDRYAYLEPFYDQLNAMIPAGSRVLAAVDQPALLGMNRYDVATLDVVGAASPKPHMPYFKGPMAKVAYLRRLGYQYIVSEAPAIAGLYNLESWYRDLSTNVYAYRAWVPYFVDWQNTVNDLEQDPRFDVRRVGPLALIKLG